MTVIVIGGDGFLLRTIRERGLGATYLGLHAGRLGFLLNDPGADPDALAERLTTCVPTIRELPVLEATADGAVATAVNDVVFERASHATAHLALTVDGETVLDPLAADGLIVSTPQGSTAYSPSETLALENVQEAVLGHNRDLRRRLGGPGAEDDAAEE